MKKRSIKKALKNVKHNKNIYILALCIFGIYILFRLLFPLYKDVKGAKITPYVDTNGTQLTLHGVKYSFIGYNMFQIAGLPAHNVGCGGPESNIDGFFSTLPRGSMIRMWAWQGSMAINPKTHKLDWAGIDRVLKAAKKYNQKIIVSLGTQSGECDDGQWKSSIWYQKGYKQIYNASGLTPLSYWDYVQKIVARYKDSQSIAMWELINEPETSDCNGYTGVACYGHQVCMDHTQSAKNLRNFFDKVGGKVKSIDPNHLIESGLIGSGQCGSDNNNYLYIHQSPSIDVASYHDYNNPYQPIPGDNWNGLAVRIKQMKELNKPLLIGELGILAVRSGDGCFTLDQRKELVQSKIDAMFTNGVAGILLWNRSPQGDTSCNYDIGNDDTIVNYSNTYKYAQ